MAADEGATQPPERPRKARKSAHAEPEANVATPARLPGPAARLDASYLDRIESLEADRERMLAENRDLQAEVRTLKDAEKGLIERLGQANETVGRLEERLRAARSSSDIATILLGLGSAIISYAAFIEGVAKSVAAFGAALAIAGVVVSRAPRRGGGPGH